jgi:OmpA family
VAQFKEVEQAELPKLKMADTLDSLKYAIYFEYATDKLNPTGQAAIELLQRDAVGAKSITVTGRADPSGMAALNVKLAKARSNSVKAEFVKWGVAGSVIKTESAVGIAHIDGQIALKQNIPLEAAAASRRADVTMQVAGKNLTSKVAHDSRFVAVDGS